MAKSRIIHADPKDRWKVISHIEDGVERVEVRQDVAPLIEWAQWLRENQVRKPDSELGVRVAIIPKEAINRAFIEGGFNDPQWWERWYADPANEMFRTCDYKRI